MATKAILNWFDRYRNEANHILQYFLSLNFLANKLVGLTLIIKYNIDVLFLGETKLGDRFPV